MNRKRRRITSGRDALVLPETSATLQSGIGKKLREAYRIGTKAAERVRDLSQFVERISFETEFLQFRELAINHPGCEDLLRSVFFAAMKQGLFTFNTFERERQKTFLKKHFKSGNGQGILNDRPLNEPLIQRMFENALSAGAMLQHALTRTFLHFSGRAMHQIIGAHQHLRREVDANLWINRCVGALAVARVARVLLEQGYLVILPKPAEDTHGKIDLIVLPKGESGTYCFSIESSLQTQGVFVHTMHARPEQWENDDRQRFFEGVRKLEQGHHGCYMPVNLTVSSLETDLARDHSLRLLMREVQEKNGCSSPPRRVAA